MRRYSIEELEEKLREWLQTGDDSAEEFLAWLWVDAELTELARLDAEIIKGAEMLAPDDEEPVLVRLLDGREGLVNPEELDFPPDECVWCSGSPSWASTWAPERPTRATQGRRYTAEELGEKLSEWSEDGDDSAERFLLWLRARRRTHRKD